MYQSNQNFGGQQGYYQPNQSVFRPQAFTHFPQQIQQPVLSGRIVSSQEEALASPADFSAFASFFPTPNLEKIYVKVFDPNTGTAPLQTYVKSGKGTETPVYATAEELKMLNEKVDRLIIMLSGKEEGRHAKGGSEE
jgi:hypothetical protein